MNSITTSVIHLAKQSFLIHLVCIYYVKYNTDIYTILYCNARITYSIIVVTKLWRISSGFESLNAFYYKPIILTISKSISQKNRNKNVYSHQCNGKSIREGFIKFTLAKVQTIIFSSQVVKRLGFSWSLIYRTPFLSQALSFRPQIRVCLE